jgi:hypothetical protein
MQCIDVFKWKHWGWAVPSSVQAGLAKLGFLFAFPGLNKYSNSFFPPYYHLLIDMVYFQNIGGKSTHYKTKQKSRADP